MKEWKAGCADEAWKVLVSARDVMRNDDTISRLVYVLTDAGADTEHGLAMLREMSGAQIVDGLLQHTEGCRQSIENGLRKAAA